MRVIDFNNGWTCHRLREPYSSVGEDNEIAVIARNADQPKGIALTKKLTDYLHSLNDSRPVTCGVNIFFNLLSSSGLGVYSDEEAKKEAERAGKRQRDNGNLQKKKSVGG